MGLNGQQVVTTIYMNNVVNYRVWNDLMLSSMMLQWCLTHWDQDKIATILQDIVQ